LVGKSAAYKARLDGGLALVIGRRVSARCARLIFQERQLIEQSPPNAATHWQDKSWAESHIGLGSDFGRPYKRERDLARDLAAKKEFMAG